MKPKELIGYKLVKTKYLKAVNILTQHSIDFKFFLENVLEPDNHEVHKLQKAGVLDLWFEPVYETTTEQKIVEFMSSKGFEVGESFAHELIEIIKNS